MGLMNLRGRQKNSPPYSGGLRVGFKESLFAFEYSNPYAKVQRMLTPRNYSRLLFVIPGTRDQFVRTCPRTLCTPRIFFAPR